MEELLLAASSNNRRTFRDRLQATICHDKVLEGRNLRESRVVLGAAQVGVRIPGRGERHHPDQEPLAVAVDEHAAATVAVAHVGA